MQVLTRNFTVWLVCSTFKSFHGDIHQTKLQNNEGCYGYRYAQCLHCLSSCQHLFYQRLPGEAAVSLIENLMDFGAFHEFKLSIVG